MGYFKPNKIHRTSNSIPPFTYKEFENNRMVIMSIERSFEIIWDAPLAIDLLIKISDTRKIIGMWNILAHGYDYCNTFLYLGNYKKEPAYFKSRNN